MDGGWACVWCECPDSEPGDAASSGPVSTGTLTETRKVPSACFLGGNVWAPTSPNSRPRLAQLVLGRLSLAFLAAPLFLSEAPPLQLRTHCLCSGCLPTPIVKPLIYTHRLPIPGTPQGVSRTEVRGREAGPPSGPQLAGTQLTGAIAVGGGCTQASAPLLTRPRRGTLRSFPGHTATNKATMHILIPVALHTWLGLPRRDCGL